MSKNKHIFRVDLNTWEKSDNNLDEASKYHTDITKQSCDKEDCGAKAYTRNTAPEQVGLVTITCRFTDQKCLVDSSSPTQFIGQIISSRTVIPEVTQTG